VAAHLANGVRIDALGDRIDPNTLVQPPLRPFTQFLKPSQCEGNAGQKRPGKSRSKRPLKTIGYPV
jgi:hypothetical protein